MKSIKKIISVFLAILTLFSICSTATTVFAAEYVEEQRRTEYFDLALSGYLKNIVDTENAVKISEKEEVEDVKNRENSTSEMSTFSLRGAQSTSAANALTREEVDIEHNILTLEMENGEKTAYIFSEPVSYMDEDGNLVYKDTSIIPVTDSSILNSGYTYQNSENDYKMYFGADSSVGVLLCSDLGSEIKLIPNGVNVAPGYVSSKTIDDILTDTFEYDGVFGVSSLLRYFPQLNGCKEEIILSAYDGVSRFEFTLMTGDCIAAVNSSGQIEIIDENKNILDTLKVPYAYDSSGGIDMTSEHYADCTYELEKTDDGVYMLTLVVPEDFLTDESTVYPVVIDPTTSTKYMYRDASVYSKYPTNSSFYKNETNCFGKSSDYGFGRVYSFFNLPDDLKNYATINSAYFWARETTGRTETMNVRPYIVNNTAWYNSMTWNTKPGYGDYTCSLKNINSNSSDGKGVYWYKFDIAKAVKAWTSGTTNRGIVFVSNTEINDAGYLWRAFASMENSTSSYRPYAVISYTNDTTKPVINSWSLSPSTWTTGNVTLTLKVTEKDSCGNTSSYPFYTTYNNWSTEWKNSKSKEFSTSGAVAYVAVRDSAGNKSNTITINIPIDKDPPTVNYSKNIADTTWTNDGVTVTVTASDALSGLHSSAYSYNGGSSWTSAKTYKYTANGSYTLKVRDAVGNTTTKTIAINNIDKGLPTATITSESTPLSSKLTVVGSDTLSGLHSTPYSFDNGSWQSSGTYVTQKESVVIKVRDKANNIKTFTYDCPKTSVEVVPSVANDVWTKQNVRLTITGTGIAKYKFGDNPWQTSNYYDFSENGEVIIKIEDVNGYVSDAAIYSISNIDKTAPATPDIYEEGGLVYIIPQDLAENSAPETVQYSLDGTNWVDYTDALDIVRTYGAKVYAKVIDEAGNESYVAELTLENNLGEYTASYSDIAFGEGLFPVKFDRTYTSTGGWFFTFDANITKEDENTYVFTDFYGEKQYFIDSGDGKFESADESVLTVTKDENKTDTGYSLNYGDMVVEFGADRKLSKITTDYTTTEYTWNVDGTLRIANSLWAETDGAVVSFDEKDNPIEIKITRGEGFRNVEYEWEYIPQEENEYITHLDSFTDAAGEIHTYSYVEGTEILTNNGTETITYANGRVRLIQQPNGAFVKYIYNDSAASLSNKTPGNIGAVTVKDSKGVIDTIYYSDGFEVTNSLDSYSDKAQYDPDLKKIAAVLEDQTENSISPVAYVVQEESALPPENNEPENNEPSTDGDTTESDGETATDNDAGDEANGVESDTDGDTSTDNEAGDLNDGEENGAEPGGDNNSAAEPELPLYEEIDEDTYAFYSYDTNKRVTVELEVLKSNIPDINAATFESAEAVAESKVTYVYLSDEDDSITEQNSYIKSQNGLVPKEKICCDYNEQGKTTHCSESEWLLNDWRAKYVEQYVYDSYGNLTFESKEKNKNSINSETLLVDTETKRQTFTYEYDIWNQLVKTIKDAETDNEKVTTVTYDDLGREIRVVDNGVTTAYEYYSNGDISAVTVDGAKTEYWRDGKGNISYRKDPNGEFAYYMYDDFGNHDYHIFNGYCFTYNTLGNVVAMGSRFIEDSIDRLIRVEYVYSDDIKQNLVSAEFTNGQTINYAYDANGEIASVTLNGSEISRYSYVITEYNTEITDNFSQLIKLIEENKTTVKDLGGNILYSVENLSDEETDINTIITTIGETVYKLVSEENKDTVSTNGTVDFVKTYEYEDYDESKLSKAEINGALSTSYDYNFDDTVRSVTNTFDDVTQSYTYDYDDGNITTETLMRISKDDNGATVETGESTIYTYDEDTNALVSAETSTTKWVYTYDDRGNITEEKVYSISLDENNEKVYTLIENETDTFVYSGGWLDELSSYNGQSISYDLSGNPTSYLGNTLTWTMGRQLASFGNISYTYNEDGIRTSKTSDDGITKFYLDEAKIIEQTNGSTSIHFFYDSNDEIVGFKYDGNNYFYVKNLQGDITDIVNANGEIVSSYTYDPWGDILSISGNTTIGNLNPFRYRSYYYDSDIGLYYLQSRYYDPEIGRFINCDDANYIGLEPTVVSYNPFAYCENNPVNDSDPSGSISWNSLKKSFNNIVNKLKGLVVNITEAIKKIFVSLFRIITYKNGILEVSATATAIVLDMAVKLCCNAAGVAVIKSFKFGIKLFQNLWEKRFHDFFIKQMVPVISYGTLNKLFSKVRFAIWKTISKSTKVTATYIDGYIVDKLLSRFTPLQVVAMFSSWGSFMSGVLDIADGKFNGVITVRTK